MNIGIIHEFGTEPYFIGVTPKLRKFFFYLSILSGGKIKPLHPGKKFIKHPGVPARPFIRPALIAAIPRINTMIRVVFSRGGGPI